MPPAASREPRAAIAAFLVTLIVIYSYQAYAVFARRSGETSHVPPSRLTLLTPEIAGKVHLEQTFVMHADGLEAIDVFAHPAAPGAGELRGMVELELRVEGLEGTVVRASVPAATVVAGPYYRWHLPKLDRSAGRVMTLQIALPDGSPGQGLRFERAPPPAYPSGRLYVSGREQWGDLAFRTRAARARIIDTLGEHRRRAPRLLQSDAFWIGSLVVLNWALGTLIYFLGFAPSGQAASRRD